MAEQLDRWLARYFGEVTESGDHARTVTLTSGDGSTTWDTWEIDRTDSATLVADLKRVADDVEAGLKSLGLELPKRRHTFLVRVLDNQGRTLGQTPKGITGTSNDGGIQASSVDAAALAMKAIAELWQTSLGVAASQIEALHEENRRQAADIHSLLQSEIDRKKVEADSTVVTSQQTERLVGVLEENLPHVIAMGKYYLEKKKT